MGWDANSDWSDMAPRVSCLQSIPGHISLGELYQRSLPLPLPRGVLVGWRPRQ